MIEGDELIAAAAAAQEASDYLALERHARDILERAQRNGNARELAWGYYFAGASRFQRNDGGGAERALRKAIELFTEIGDEYGIVRATLSLGVVMLDAHLDYDQARLLYDRVVPLIRKSGDRQRLAIALGNLGEICRSEGHPAKALEHAREALAIFQELGSHTDAGWILSDIAHYHVLQRNFAAAAEALHLAYAELRYESTPRWLAWYFDIWFILAAELEQWEAAASLLGFTDHYRDANNAPRMQALLPWFSHPVERLAKHARSDEHLHDLRIAGEALTLEEAQALAQHIWAR